ncbi:MAG: Acetoin:2,6-dichlorophenolindophenol oxidoreductase subunit alpha [Anaerolineales bacterium]|nr:Acetoin:2,6-dichlorophenolindophenol oxidoreductase subunit alpha [Anaerolineales bacterium]
MNLTDEQLLDIYYWMRLTRAIDERITLLYNQGKILGAAFSERGHEAISVGAAGALEDDDIVAPMHRDLGAYLVRGLPAREIMAQHLGKVTGTSRGRDSNMHGLGDLSHGIIGFVSMLPASLPVTVGVGLSFWLRDEGRVAMTWFGDGATSTGKFHEGLNFAGVFKLPVVFICENNQYAYSTPTSRQFAIEDIADRAAGYGFPGIIVDGNDVLEVYEATKAAVDRARAGGGPTLIECKTMRMLGHAFHDNAEYVPDELLAEWEKKDPVAQYENALIEREVLTEERRQEIESRVRDTLEEAQAFAEESPMPDPADLEKGVYHEPGCYWEQQVNSD